MRKEHEMEKERELVTVSISKMEKNGTIRVIPLGDASIQAAQSLVDDLSLFNPEGVSVSIFFNGGEK
jgi:hypothetical protein